MFMPVITKFSALDDSVGNPSVPPEPVTRSIAHLHCAMQSRACSSVWYARLRSCGENEARAWCHLSGPATREAGNVEAPKRESTLLHEAAPVTTDIWAEVMARPVRVKRVRVHRRRQCKDACKPMRYKQHRRHHLQTPQVAQEKSATIAAFVRGAS
jgi:hypothetical protein